jgi:hypothetical protein
MQGDIDRSVIVWPRDSSKVCIRLINSRRSWFTARNGDAVLLTQVGKTERHFIGTVEVYRAFPAEENGRVVESVKDWLDGTEAPSFVTGKRGGR